MTINNLIHKPAYRWQFFKWILFEPILLRRYEHSLGKNQKIREFFRSIFWVILAVILIWLVVNTFIALLDLPQVHPDSFRLEIIEKYRTQSFLWQKFLSLAQGTVNHLAVGLFLGLVAGSIIGLKIDMAFGLAVVLAVSLIFGLALGLTVGFAYSISFGLISGTAVGLVGGSSYRKIFGLLSGLISGGILGLTFGLTFGSAEGLGAGLAVISGWYISYFRLFPFYLFYVITDFFYSDFSRNSYSRDGVIWLPIPGVRARLVRKAQQRPEEAFAFVDFLLKFRPLQKTLATHLTHAATAGLWVREKFFREALRRSPLISEDRLKYKPSKQWYEKLDRVRQLLTTSEQQSHIGLKVNSFEKYLKHLEEFEDITMKRESSCWNHYYFEALDKWRQLAGEEFQNLKLTAEAQEPITTNKYRVGEALNPEIDQDVFVGREDLKSTLQNRILTSVSMPLFLIHGQRRVGKTSLIKFLPYILGSGFKVIFLDLQALRSIDDWFIQIRRGFNEALVIFEENVIASPESSWLDSWLHLQQHMEKSAYMEEQKIVFAFDEYEKVHQHFQKDPPAAVDLLGAMRSFSQHQNRIIFLFVGTYLFYELRDPEWSNYFVQSVRLKVDYLGKEDVFKLIRVSLLDFPREVLEEIFRLTQGHPTLLQKICYEMVNIANTQNRRMITLNDLGEILNRYILIPQNGVNEIFWQQFCKEEKMKTTVRQIIDGREPVEKKSLFILLEHGFVVKHGQSFQMRVPIFEMWINRFGDYI